MKTHAQSGFILLLVILVMGAVLIMLAGIIRYGTSSTKLQRTTIRNAQAIALAEGGLEKAVYELNQNPSYSGETNTSLGNGTFTTSVTTIDSRTKRVTVTASIPDSTNPITEKTVKANVGIDADIVSFSYGVQAGNGGFQLQNNSFVKGNIYANGDVIGATGAYATGTVVVAGGTSVTADQEHGTYNADYVFGQTSPVLDVAQSFQLSADAFVNKVSLYIKKTGSPSNKTVYILADNAGVPSKTIIGTATLNASSVTGTLSWVDVSFSSPPALVGGLTYWLAIDTSANATNYFVLGSDTTDAYAAGTAKYSASWNASTPVWNATTRDFNFKVWTGGVNTKIDNLHVYQNAKAHRIEDSDVDGDAYYQEISNTSVAGTSYPGSADPGPQDMPISDGQIADWKAAAEAGGVTSGDASYTNNCSVNLGPRKITGNLSVTNGCTLTINGTLHVEGNVTFENNVTVKLASSYGASSGVIVVDGKVDVLNNVTFQNSGTAGSFLLLLSTNTSVDSADPAIDVSNNGSVAVFYAAQGMVKVANNATLKEVTGFKIYLDNNASVQYDYGLANVNFSSGPGGSWEIVPGTYVIVP